MLEIAPTDIGKYANIIRVAQEELANMDVHVCGRCLRAFNFVEEFQSHKEDDACEKENSSLKESLNTKPTIWAFTLWKATQLHARKESNSSNSWALYQHWVKLEESVREPWIVASRTIQSFGKIGHGQLQEMPVRITKTVVNPNNNNNNNNTANSNNTSNVSPTRKSSGGKLSTVASQLKDTENERPKSKPGTPTPQSVSSQSSITGTVKNNNRIATRVDPKTEQRTEEAVESIVAKRFNPRRKTHEYLVKWIDRSHNENTWEVMANLERVPYFLQMFEKQLARQKLKREKSLDALKRMQQEKPQQDKQGSQATSKMDSAPHSPQASAISPNSGVGPSRPSRTSKTKALDQFKQWVNESGAGEGSTSPSSANEDESVTEQEWSTGGTTAATVKRKLNHTDSSAEGAALNASNESIDLEDLEEDLIPSHTVKRLKNGGSSVQLNKPKLQTSIQTTPARINGNSSSSSLFSEKEQKMGEIIYTEDSTSSGIFRKPEMPNTIQTKRPKECPVRYLSVSEVANNNSGIFRVESESSSMSPVPKSSSAGTSSAGIPPAKRMAVARASGNNSPVTVGQRPHVLRAPGQVPPIQRRPVGGHSSTQNALRQTPIPARTGAGSGPGARMLVTRANTPQQRQLSGTKAVTPEQKILQLSKSGDLKVTRKVMTREDLMAQRATQVRQQRQQQAHAMQQQQQQQAQIQKVQQLTTLRQQSTATAAAAKVQAMQIEMEVEQEDLQQHQAQLCPITGKLIGQEETQLQMEQEQQQEQQREQIEAAAQALLGGDQQVLTNEDGSALLVRGEDGTVYQVAGKNAEGQTILVTQGPDGEQQFAYVAAAEGEDQDVLTLDNAVAEAVAAVGQQNDTAADGEHILVSMTEEELAQHQAVLQQQQQQQQEAAPAGSTPHTAQIHITTSDSDGTEAQIPAEVVQADLPSPGGTRRVVLLLQDGTFMMTEMQEDQFKALNIPT